MSYFQSSSPSSSSSPEYSSLSRLLHRAEILLDDPGAIISAWNRDTSIHRREYLRGTHRAGYALPGTGHAYARPELLASEWLNVGKEVNGMEIIGKRITKEDEMEGEMKRRRIMTKLKNLKESSGGGGDVVESSRNQMEDEENLLPHVYILLMDEASGDYYTVERRHGWDKEENEEEGGDVCFIDGELFEEGEEEEDVGRIDVERGEEMVAGEENITKCKDELRLIGEMIDLSNKNRRLAMRDDEYLVYSVSTSVVSTIIAASSTAATTSLSLSSLSSSSSSSSSSPSMPTLLVSKERWVLARGSTVKKSQDERGGGGGGGGGDGVLAQVELVGKSIV